MRALKEFLEGIAAYGPRYLGELIAIFSGPKRFMAALELDAPDLLSRALLFYVMSLSIAFVFQLPFRAPAEELWIPFVVTMSVSLVSIFINTALVMLAFRMVGGSGSLQHHLILSFFVLGPFNVLISLIAAASKGIVKLRSPELLSLYDEAFEKAFLPLNFGDPANARFIPLVENGATLAATLFTFVAVYSFTLTWMILTWGGFRHLNSVARGRSALAMLLMLLLTVPTSIAVLAAKFALGVEVY